MKKRLLTKSFCLWIFTLSFYTGIASGQSIETIGNVTAFQHRVEVTHPGASGISVVDLGAGVFFKDTYVTKSQARLKLLFQDDTILSLGENTSLQISENIYDPAVSKRSTVITILNGTIRTLIGKIFVGEGSKFEIHTPTAAAAARGTYFIVWTSNEGGESLSGVVNIGESGKVEVRNIESDIQGSVVLEQNEFTLINKGQPPVPAAKINLNLLSGLLLSTEVKDQVKEEVPKGMEAPGSNVSAETAKVPSPATAPGTNQSGSSSNELSALPSNPSVPPIQQQPMVNKTPVTISITFP